MLEPLEAIQIVYSVTKVIYDQVQLVKANKAQFQRLAGRIKIIEDSLKGLESIPDSGKFRSALNAFKDCLEECLTLIQQFTGKRWFKRVLLAGTYRDRFTELNKQIKQSMNDLNLGLNAQQVMNREQDRKDQETDYQDICQKQNEIIRLNQEELKQIQKLERQQQVHHQILEGQLQSMQLQIKQLNIKVLPPKSPIDPHFIIPYFDILFDREIGKGLFGTIYLARWCEQPIAVRALEGKFTENDQNQFIREVSIMSRLRSPLIVQFLGVCLEPGRACLAMEYMERGSLNDLLNKITLNSEQQHCIALNIARGLHYLHMKGVLHRDLKSTNVLINKMWEAKLSDFGLSRVLRSTSIATLKEQKSQGLQWLAPETFSIHPSYTEHSDIYSYGVILWEIVTGKRPYVGLSEREIIERSVQGKREEIPGDIPEIYRTVIQACWSIDPGQRPNLVDIIRDLERYDIRPPSPNPEVFYEQGIAYEKQTHYPEAFNFYQRAADKDHYKALTHLGLFHLKGLGTHQNKSRAHQCFFRAAERGHIRAQYNLAVMLEKGDGIPKNQEQALHWYQKAAEQGDQQAKEKTARLLSRMSVQ